MKKLQKQQTKLIPNVDHGFARYVFGERYILKSDSYEEAIKKIREDKKSCEKDNLLYYNKKSLWQEFQFLFMIQYIEHETGELISRLATNNKIKATKYIQRLKYNSELDDKRKGTNRAFSPYALAVLLNLSLGDLFKIVNKHTNNFKGKKRIVKELKAFKKYRNCFIHKAFSNSTDITRVWDEGIKSGNKVLEYYNDIRLPNKF